MERLIKLRLRNAKGEYEEFFQDFVPQSKRLEYMRLERELEKKENVAQEDYDKLQVEFVASLFNDKKVTSKAILDGMDAQDKSEIYDIIRYRVLGFSKEEDEAAKKALMAQLLAGQESTNSNLTLPEQ